MNKVTQHERNRRPVGTAEESAFLDLLRTCDVLSRRLAAILKPVGLSLTQYNVLRILRGAGEALSCGEIAGRMITRDPDVTRLFDRMERRGLIARTRAPKDRRMVLASITSAGLKVLAGLDAPVRQAHLRQLGHLGPRRLRELAVLLRVVRSEET